MAHPSSSSTGVHVVQGGGRRAVRGQSLLHAALGKSFLDLLRRQISTLTSVPFDRLGDDVGDADVYGVQRNGRTGTKKPDAHFVAMTFPEPWPKPKSQMLDIDFAGVAEVGETTYLSETAVKNEPNIQVVQQELEDLEAAYAEPSVNILAGGKLYLKDNWVIKAFDFAIKERPTLRQPFVPWRLEKLHQCPGPNKSRYLYEFKPEQLVGNRNVHPNIEPHLTTPLTVDLYELKLQAEVWARAEKRKHWTKPY